MPASSAATKTEEETKAAQSAGNPDKGASSSGPEKAKGAMDETKAPNEPAE